MLWWVAVTLALRSVFEPVMVAYYLWPPLAVALAAAARDWSRLIPTGCVVVVLTFFSQVQWRNPWSWWTPMVIGLALAIYFARFGPASAPRRRCCQSRGSSSPPTARHEAISPADSGMTGLAPAAARALR